MPRKYCLFGIVCIGVLVSDIGITQSRKNNIITTAVKENNPRSSQKTWFPYIDMDSRGPLAESNQRQYYLLGDTLINHFYPDSIEIKIITSDGDSEKIWLKSPHILDIRPGIVIYGGGIKFEENEFPNPEDGILQVNVHEPGYRKISYRSFNDQRIYTYRMEWSRIVFPGGR